jgi:hypothetical protein
MSDCCLPPSEHIFCNIMATIIYISMTWWECPLCTRSTRWVGLFYSHRTVTTCPRVDMSFHSDTLSYFQANQSLSVLQNYVRLEEKQKIQIYCLWFRDHRGRDRIVVGFTTTYAISVYHPPSSTNKTDHHDITEILLKVALNSISLTLSPVFVLIRQHTRRGAY